MMGRHCTICGLYDCCEPLCGDPRNGTCGASECNQIYRNADEGCFLCKPKENTMITEQTQASDLLIDVVGRDHFIAGWNAAIQNVMPGRVGPPVTAEDAWNAFVPSEEIIASVQELDEKLANVTDQTLDLLSSAGDRSTRDAAHLMDLCIAGTIDVLVGHGTVTIKPYRVAELVERIPPRTRDDDGNWTVTLLPDPDESPSINPSQTSDEIASLAGRVMNISVDEIGETGITKSMLLKYAKQLAGSALSQTNVDN